MKVTPAATEQLAKLLKVGEFLRVGLNAGGCSGLTIVLEKVTTTKNTIESSTSVTGTDNILWADPMSRQYLTGATLDIDPSIFNAGFIVKPPPGTASCGCGSSIQIPKE